MEYMGNKAYWEEKFKCRGDKILEPENALVKHLKCLQPGSVLDVACGDGRNTLFLAEKGFRVTGIDFSEKALERLKNFALKSNLSVISKQVDLSKQTAFYDLGMFDNIIVNHYRLQKHQLYELKKHLNNQGVLFVSGFGEKHTIDSKIRKEDLILSSDFDEIKKDFDLIRFDEHQDERGAFVMYIFRLK